MILGGGQPPRDAFCRHQHRSPAGHTDAAPDPQPARGGAHGTHQPGAGLLGEYGIVFAQGTKPVRRGLAVLLAEEDPRLSGMAASSSPISTGSSGPLMSAS